MTKLFLLVVLLLTGCVDEYPKARGDARLAVFKECMELAAKMPRQSDDDVSDVVEQCASSSYYMTNHITEQKELK